MSTSYLQLALMLMLGVWLGYRVALWWSSKSLDRVIAEKMAAGGWQPSEEFMTMLRRPTVEGVARKTLRKMGLCAHADMMLAGTPITLVCHDKALLQRAVTAIIKEKDPIEAHMMLALLHARADAAVASLAPKPSGMPTFTDGPPKSQQSGSPTAPGTTAFTVIEGDKK